MRYLIFLLLCNSLVSAAETYIIDPVTSKINFDGSSTLHDFSGVAKITGGTLYLDGSSSAGKVESDATSMNTDSSGRDKKLHGEIMATKTYPIVRFDLQSWTTNASGGTATGWWTMHGVTRAISFPVTLTLGTTEGSLHATSSFVLDIREWDIPVPRAALIITVDPKITVHVDLGMSVAAKTVAQPVAFSRTCAGIAVTDSTQKPVDLSQLAQGRPLVLFDYDGTSEAKAWVATLSAKLPAAQTPIPILLGQGLSDYYRQKALKYAPTGALLDMTGSIASSLHIPKREVMVLTVSKNGMVSDAYTSEANDKDRDRILTELGVGIP